MSQEHDGDYWFVPKRHGYGATPSNWKGFVATAAFAIMLPLVSVPWILSLSDDTRLVGIVIWVLAVLYAVWQFTKFAKRKTDGEWMWRWNGKPYREIMEESGKD
ncbi:MAG: hypothetical protein RIC14_16175 [Filomicrobium sp.]